MNAFTVDKHHRIPPFHSHSSFVSLPCPSPRHYHRQLHRPPRSPILIPITRKFVERPYHLPPPSHRCESNISFHPPKDAEPTSTSSTSSAPPPSSCISPSRCLSGFFSELSHIKETITEGVNNLFGKWGVVVYRHPYSVICASIGLLLVCSIGFLPGIPQWIDGAENLYSLPYSVAKDTRTIHTTFFGDTATRKNALIVTNLNQQDTNILTWNLLEELKRVDGIVRGKDIDPEGRMIRIPKTEAEPVNRFGKPEGKEVDPSTSGINSNALEDDYLTFENICARNPWHKCSVDSVLEMGLDRWRTILGREGQPPLIPVFDGLAVNPSTKKFYVPEYYLGGTNIHRCVLELPDLVVDQLVKKEDIVGPGKQRGYTACNLQCITRVEGFLMTYDEDDKPKYLKRNDLWEDVFISTMKENQHFGSFHVSLQAFKSRDDELKSSTGESNDVVFVVLTFVILISYSSALNFSCDLYRSKAYPALAGAGASMLGLASGMGLVSLCQVAMVPTVLICPFLVMGIGVDDMFVIINSYSLSYMVQSAEERCVVSLRDSGLSITITTTTNLIAFSVGAFSPYLSIKNFCLYSAAGLGLGYLYVLTFFFAFLCIDAKREQHARVCFFCLPGGSQKETAGHCKTRGEQSVMQQISTYSLVTYKVKVSADDKLSRQQPLSSHSDLSNIPSKPKPNGLPQPQSFSSLSASFPASQTFTGNALSLGNSPGIPAEGGSVREESSSCSFTSALESYDPVLARQAVYEEPRGNVGRRWRRFFLNQYGPFLMRPTVKAVVLLAFATFFGISIYGFTKLEQGLNLTELAPDMSYLRHFDKDVERFFTKFDAPVDIFFPDRTAWWEDNVHESIRELHDRLNGRASSKMTLNPFLKLLDSSVYGPKLRSGNKHTFERTLYEALSDEESPFKQFEYDFIWEGRELYSWRFRVLPVFMRTSEERASWMEQIRADAKAQIYANPPLLALPYNFMMIFYESDLGILSSVVQNMTVAAVVMLLVAFVLIPQAGAALLVIFVMGLIDIGVFGFMYFWGVKLNMVSMINLVISIGFAVDYSAHMCHTFTHCEGGSRNFRVIESLVLMGTPIFHGALSTLLGVFMLGMSSSYVFRIFFKMMVMVIAFGSLHGVVLLPVLLSLVGQMGKQHGTGNANNSEKTGTEIEPTTILCTPADVLVDDGIELPVKTPHTNSSRYTINNIHTSNRSCNSGRSTTRMPV